ncbi:MAG: LysR family transcriptional regulator [Oscillospiraceae bacterium]|jgi:molybdate transport system regulatory protein|nr:LysR family transcriptional regulator [Oscillospiraceae bacterium]
MENRLDFITRLRVTASGADTKTAFGHGTAQLLQGVVELHSLNRAAKRMGMAYSKAWKSIRDTESHLGFALLERQAQHGSVLTENGEKFLEAFLAAEQAADAAAREVFKSRGY